MEELFPKYESSERNLSRSHPILTTHLFSGLQLRSRQSRTGSSEIAKLLTFIEQSDVRAARAIALNPTFIESNIDFLDSGEAIAAALKTQLYSFGKELANHGYAQPENLLLNAIQSENREEALRLIYNSYFCKKPELEYWLLLYKQWNTLAETLNNENYYLNRNYAHSHDFLNSTTLIRNALVQALNKGAPELAETLLEIEPSLMSTSLLKIALKHNYIKFIYKYWTIYKPFKLIPKVLSYLMENERLIEAKKVLEWPGATDQTGIFDILIQYDAPVITQEYLENRRVPNKVEEFLKSIEAKKYDVALILLTSKFIRTVLNWQKIQSKLVNLICEGSACIYAVEMLSLIKAEKWDHHLSIELCESVERLLKKSIEFLKCKKPILFLVLLAEFLGNIGDTSLAHRHACYRVRTVVLRFASELESNMLEEDVIEFYLQQTDIENRSALYIISYNKFYNLLDAQDIGSITRKLWEGNRKHYGILKASTVYKTVESHHKSLRILRPMDRSKPYLFQFEQWTESCKLRFLGQAATTVFLVVVYTFMIQFATQSGNMEDVSQDPTALILLRVSQFWNTGLFLEKILYLLFQIKTGRKNLIDWWAWLDILIFVQMASIMLELNKIWAGEGKLISFISPKDFNALMHGLMLTLIWIRLISVLSTTMLYGPLIKLIVLILMKLLAYFFILFVIYFVSALLFTIFFGDKSNFANFSLSFRTLFAASYNNHDLEQFEVSSKRYMGEIVLGIYLILTFIIMKNFLIAILANAYEKLHMQVESEYRSTLINFHNKWKWNEEYGIFIMLPSPMSWIVILISPILLMSNNPKKYNNLFAKCFFPIFVIPQFIYFAVMSSLYVPSALFKTLRIYAKSGNKKRNQIYIIKDEKDETIKTEKAVLSYRRAALWSLVGPFVVLAAYLRDLGNFWFILYMENETDKNENYFHKEQFVMNMQEYLDSIEAKEISFNDFISGFKYKSARVSSKDVEEFCSKFLLTDGMIDISIMQAILNKQDSYPGSYIKQAKHICLPWIFQAIENFQRLIGSVPIHGILVPKAYVTGETPQIKRTKVVALKADAMYRELRGFMTELVYLMEKLTEKLSNL